METYRRQVQELQRGTEAQEAIRRFAEEQERERDRILAELRRQQEVSATELVRKTDMEERSWGDERKAIILSISTFFFKQRVHS